MIAEMELHKKIYSELSAAFNIPICKHYQRNNGKASIIFEQIADTPHLYYDNIEEYTRVSIQITSLSTDEDEAVKNYAIAENIMQQLNFNILNRQVFYDEEVKEYNAIGTFVIAIKRN